MNDDVGLTRGSENLFEDIGVPNAKDHLVKAQLVSKIMDVMEERGLTQVATAKILGVTQPEISNMLRGRFSRISVEKLLRHLVALGQDVEIVVKPRHDRQHPPELRVA